MSVGICEQMANGERGWWESVAGVHGTSGEAMT
jgi:hypothetical protein